MMKLENLIAEILKEELNINYSDIQIKSVGGGSINVAYHIRLDSGKHFFLKLNSSGKYPALFEKEKNGLLILAEQEIFLVPEIIVSKTIDDIQMLLLEWIDAGQTDRKFWQSFGEQLARLHHVTNEHFGFYEDNYMGALPQNNTNTKSWIDFFIHYRLHPQIKIAINKNLLRKNHVADFEMLEGKLGSIFNEEKPSLLHGDLWSGNYMCNDASQPVLIDPAVYFGHRSMDLAMTTLFGGFEKHFYDSYHYHFPFPPGYDAQWEVCNLYPLLIHLNLFGSGYLNQLENIFNKYR